MAKLYLINFKDNVKKYVVSQGLCEIEETYHSGFKSIEVVDTEPIVLGSNKSDLLMDCLNFVQSGANTQPNSTRVELEDKIKQNLGI